jgi:uncharacterized protein YrrD
MIVVGSKLIHMPVMSLQTGSQLAKTSSAIIDPRTLTIVAYEVEGALLDERPSLLRVADVREFSEIGLIIDSSDELVTSGDVLQLDNLYTLGFNLVGMPVIDEKKRKLGRVIDYTIDSVGFVVQQITVQRPLLKRLNDTEFLIHRKQITEINDTHIIVHSQIKTPEPVRTAPTQSAYTNPFRSPRPIVERDS